MASISKELAFKYNFRKKIISFSLDDDFKHKYGDQENLLEGHGLSLNKIFIKLSKQLWNK